MDFFWLKKLISVFIMPMSLVTIAILIALVLFNARPKTSFRLLLISFIILYGLSIRPIASRLVYSLEQQFPIYQKLNINIDYIVILGCGHTSESNFPAVAQLKHCSLERMVEALRISRLHPNAQIIASGYGGRDNTPNALVVKEALTSLGTMENKIIVEPFPRDTEEEAQLIAPRISGQNSILVTSGYHMPRAMKFFQQQGVDPIAAPAGKWVKNIDKPLTANQFIPNSSNLTYSTIAWYEYVGQLWQKLKRMLA